MGRRSVSQRDLARALGMPQSSLNRLLAGHQALRIIDVGRIASALIVEPDLLLCQPQRRTKSTPSQPMPDITLFDGLRRGLS